MALTGMLILALYSGMMLSVFNIRLARENMRSTQIALEKIESLRVFSFDQITSNGIVPKTFVAPYSSDGTNILGPMYTGTVSVVTVPGFKRNYSNDVRMVTISVGWLSGGMPRNRQVWSFVSRYGIQHKLYY
jgi:hypothetical protein